MLIVFPTQLKDHSKKVECIRKNDDEEFRPNIEWVLFEWLVIVAPKPMYSISLCVSVSVAHITTCKHGHQ